MTKEVPGGAVDGANQAFTTAAPYIAGTLLVWYNGLAISDFTELGGVAFSVGFTPLPGDDLAVYYRQGL